MTPYQRIIKLWLITALFIFLFPGTNFAETYKVIRVVDGDTISINYQDKQEKIRLLCVDTPESVHRDKKQNILMGKVASAYAEKRLAGKEIELEFEGSRIRGNYGRLLAYVIVDGNNFNLELVRQGLSPYYTKYGKSEKYHQQFIDAEKSARQDKLHIWGDEELTQKYLRLKSKWGQKASTSIDTETLIPTEVVNYIGNSKSKKLHLPPCRWALKISNRNKTVFKTKEEAVRLGYVACKACKP